jgi:hypothetical protein
MIASDYLVRSSSGFAAYMALQCRLLSRFRARGGSDGEWIARLAPAFRRRYGWLLEG